MIGKFNYLKGLFLAYCALLSYLSFMKVEMVVQTSDKLNHLIAFCVFSSLFMVSFQSFSFMKVLLVSVLFGSYIEIVQYFLPYRSFELLDIAADLLGAFIGWILIKFFLTRVLKVKIS